MCMYKYACVLCVCVCVCVCMYVCVCISTYVRMPMCVWWCGHIDVFACIHSPSTGVVELSI